MRRAVVVVFLFLVAPLAGRAQSEPNPSGHWVGTLNTPSGPLPVEVDIARSSTGQLSGTINLRHLKAVGLPLVNIQMNGTSITFSPRTDEGFDGAVSDNDTVITGQLVTRNKASIPFTLRRVGEPQIDPPALSPPVTRDLEGTWNATMGTPTIHARLILANHPNGTSTGMFVNVDEGSMQLPVAMITQMGSDVTMSVRVVDGMLTGTLTDDGTELRGTFTADGRSTPMTFTRESR